MSVKVLGISASLRNARVSNGSRVLVEELSAIKTENELFDFLEQEAQSLLDLFKSAGRDEAIPFDQIYSYLGKHGGNSGLSNSEIALASALWSAIQLGAEVEYISLKDFLARPSPERIKKLKEKLIEADGIILSTPVYFGDRSSLSQDLVELIRNDEKLKNQLAGKVYTGIAVGAKRNGGQETTLVYQLMDMINLGFLGVGNDSDTTSQYGGTGHAGDIGTMAKDKYGLETSMGAGRRLTRIATMLAKVENKKLIDKPKVVYLILQDKNNFARNYVKEICNRYQDDFDSTILDITEKKIFACIACDICPTHIDSDSVYRCIIKSENDDLEELHPYFLQADVIVPVAYSPQNRDGIQSNIQNFIERTRYIRRGDYVMSDILSVPLILEEIGAGENFHFRFTTFLVRHHTVLSKPMIAYFSNDKELNRDQIDDQIEKTIISSRNVTISRLVSNLEKVEKLKYKPVGYVLSAMKDLEDERLLKRSKMMEDRTRRLIEQAGTRIEDISNIDSKE